MCNSEIEQGAVLTTDFHFPGQQYVYHGKVRDVYTVQGKLVMIATDRISAFDHVLPRPIPFKGQVLNQLASHFLNACSEIVPNWLVSCPDPNVSIGHFCEPIRIEMVIRGYLAGHAWREYDAGKRTICGVTMPEGMKEGDRFPEPIITPATKADEGHDEDISAEEILRQKIVTKDQWKQLSDYTIQLFNKGTQMAKEQGLILVDTKYEFGFFNHKITLMDEIHTPDSSRYYYLEGYEDRQARGEKQKQLSKEFVREWLMANGFQGKAGQTMPEMPDHFVKEVSDRYIELYELLTGEQFQPRDYTNTYKQIEVNVINALG